MRPSQSLLAPKLSHETRVKLGSGLGFGYVKLGRLAALVFARARRWPVSHSERGGSWWRKDDKECVGLGRVPHSNTIAFLYRRVFLCFVTCSSLPFRSSTLPQKSECLNLSTALHRFRGSENTRRTLSKCLATSQ